MANVPLTGTEGYFTRQGTIVGEYNRVAALYGSVLTSGFQAIWNQFISSDQAAVENLPTAVADYRLSGQQYQNVLQGDGALASALQVSDYASVVPYTLQQSFIVLIGQMIGASQSIQAATITAVVTPWASNAGSTTVVLGYKNPYGQQIDALFAETIITTCTNSSSAYQETLQAVGAPQVPNNSYLWPGGSGANVTFAVVNPAVTGSNNFVTDGGFSSWSGTGANTPDNWDIVDGSAGVTVFQGTGQGVRDATSAAKLTSDGAQATQLAQTLSLAINTVYMVTVQAKVSATGGAGTLVMQLTDGDGNVLTDDQGTSLSYSRNFTAQVTTSYQCFTVFFSTPRQLPTTTRLEVGYGTADTATRSLYIDLVAVMAATQLYTGGPYIAAVAGANPTAFGDYWTCVFTNSLTSQSFAIGMNRLYNTLAMQVYFPSSGSPTVSDSLVLH